MTSAPTYPHRSPSPTEATTDAVTWVQAQCDEAARVQEAVRAQAGLLVDLAGRLAAAFQNGQQAFFFGNGGSAADAQHWAAELSGRFYLDRPGLAAHALSANTSQLTAIANDYGYDDVFARPLAAMGRPGDVAIGISTSGTSRNVLRALEAGRAKGLLTVGFCGETPDAMRACCEVVVTVPSRDVGRVQEGHELAAHVVLALVERMLFGRAAT